MEIINIYCDESCHLLHDKESNIMAIAGLICPKNKYKEVRDEINRIKLKHKISKNIEMKWTKISESKKLAYLELIELFFEKEYLEFRIVLIDKRTLDDTSNFNTFYYKMCYLLLKYMMKPNTINNIYLDKKDTRGFERIEILHKCLSEIRDKYDMHSIKTRNVQNIQSHDVALMQINDILMGAMVYFNRNLDKVKAKLDIIDFIKDKAGLSLEKTTPLSQHKFNIFYFKKDKNEEM